MYRDLDFASISYDMGAMKPSRALYADALRKASHVGRLLHGRELPDLAPEQVLHVGDDLGKDYLAAKAAGCRALLYDPEGKAVVAAAEKGVPPNDIIQSLDDLPHRIDALMGVAAT